jgi:hypothetical protein
MFAGMARSYRQLFLQVIQISCVSNR